MCIIHGVLYKINTAGKPIKAHLFFTQPVNLYFFYDYKKMKPQAGSDTLYKSPEQYVLIAEELPQLLWHLCYQLIHMRPLVGVDTCGQQHQGDVWYWEILGVV